MARGRKSGCPTNIRDWQVSILDKEAAGEIWVRIAGLRTLVRSVESETADGSAGTDLWEEPYVTKRAVTLKLSGKAVGSVASGEMDPGQAMLDRYAELGGCGADATIKFVDPYSHVLVADFAVTAAEKQAGDEGNDVSWELRQVGESEALPYVAVRAVTLTAAAMTLQAGETATARFAFTPENASNRRYRLLVNGKEHIALSNIADGAFDVTGLAAGEATVDVVSLNGQKTARLTVTVEADNGADDA